MLFIKSMILFFIMMLPLTASSLESESTLKKKCETCEDINNNFVSGLLRTAKANFGGGNTHWEESRLGAFRFSETRLVDIQETLCSNARHTAAVCHGMAEEHEDLIEEWWFKVYQKAPESADLRQWLCVDKLQVCCSFAHYGSQCAACLFCGGRGSCRGNGTRIGDGGCDCESGYQGAQCDSCSADRYAAQKDGDGGLLLCELCPVMCDGCRGPQSHECLKCASGYQMSSDGRCEDVDECKAVEGNPSPCQVEEFCVNSAGSFTCRACDKSCAEGCTAEGDAFCRNCSSGYELRDGRCQDVDECKAVEGNPSPCQVEEFCVNSAGSFTCRACDKSCAEGCTAEGDAFCRNCSSGYELRDGRCQDVDECSFESHSVCTAPHEVCSNTVGSFTCICDSGFERGASEHDAVTGGKPCVSVVVPQLPPTEGEDEGEKLSDQLHEEL